MLNIPRCAYCVQISTTFLLSSTDAFSTPSSLMFALMNSTARYAPVVTACVDAPGEPVDDRAARDQAEQERRVEQRQLVEVLRQAVGQQA